MKGHARDVAAWPVEARDQTGLDGIKPPTNTMGMVVVAAFAANAAGGANAAIRSTRLPTRSAANAGS